MPPKILNGRYELDEVIGRGGMATVYRARDLKLGERPVAIKILHSYYASDPQFLLRFEHEAQSAANISAHPNIVDVYDVGQEGDTHYIVMEYVAGQSLKELVQQGVLSVEQALPIVQQVAEGLEAAHRRGLVHRDVKPQNIIVSPDGQVRIADFGIAKATDVNAFTPGLTAPGTTFGTAEYISPEQAQGQPATPQSDIYALGVTFYEMLTGRLPFVGDTPLALAMQHVQVDPVPPRRLNPQIPPQLEALMLRALAKNPAARYSSARAFAQELRTYRERGEQQTITGVVPPGGHQRPAVVAPQRQGGYPPAQGGPGQRQAGYQGGPGQRQAGYPPGQEPPARRPAPPPAPAVMAPPQSRGAGCGIFVLGMALLAGLIGLAYLVFATDFLNTVSSLFNNNQRPAPTSSVATETLPPDVPTPSPTSVVLVVVPDVVQRNDAEARALLQQAGLTFETHPAIHDPTVPQGLVISQDVPAGSQIPQGSVVTYTVSLGPQPPTVIDVPDVTRQSFDSARSQLEALGFQVQRQDQPSQLQAGFVVRQDPQAGLRLPAGSTVTLVVSLGDVIAFPNVIGLDRFEAEAIINVTPNLVLRFVDEQDASRLPNFDSFRPNEVVSAQANGVAISNGSLIARDAEIVLGVRKP